MVKFCLNNRYGMPYAIYECMCNDCNWMGELRALTSDNWDHYRYCPQCGGDDIDEFDDGKYREYIIMPTEWGTYHDNGVDTGYDKPIEYGKKEIGMKIDIAIMNKVREKEQYDEDLFRCLTADICPICGSDLRYKLFEDGGTNYKCSSATCTFAHSTSKGG